MKRSFEIIATFVGVAIMAAIIFVKAGSQTSGNASQSGGMQTAEMANAFGSAGSNLIKTIEGG